MPNNYSNDQAPGDLPNWRPDAETGSKWKGPLQHEDWENVQGNFGGVDFWVIGGSDREPVRVGEYKKPYSRGAKLESMGQDPREIGVTILAVKSQLKALQKLRDAQILKTYRDQTLGSFTALLVDVGASWSSQKLHFYQCELTFKRDGIQGRVTSPVIPQGAYEAAKSQYNSVFNSFDGDDGLSGTPDWSDKTATAPSASRAQSDFTTFSNEWDVFDSAMVEQLDKGPDPSIGKNELARSASSLAAAGAAFVSSMEQVASEAQGLIAGTADLAYGFRDSISALNSRVSDAVRAVANDPVSWTKIMITEPVDIATLIQRELGVVSEGIVAAVMEASQGGYVIDPFMVPAGLEISIPANLDEFS